ncbi:MAG: HAMP domain-containing histidine kinase [Gammaproteobacteria bacterium]|nr:HAMP domain-containing histidine kinase [Gammaproteobacteria bacterium]
MRLPALLRTSVFQLTLVYMALFSLSVLALFTFIYWSTLGYLERQTNAIIETEIKGLLEQADRRGLVGLVDVINERVRRDTENRYAYLLVDAGLRPLAGNVGYWPREFDRSGGWYDFLKAETDGDLTPVRALVLGVGPGFRLMVGRDIRELERINATFRDASLWGLSLTLGLALIGGLLVGWSAQRRVAQINRTTRKIIAGDLSQRVPVRGTDDEYDELIANLNAMLDQIETLMGGIRHVGDSIAHDLRGPLTRLKNRLETLAGESSPSREGIAESVAQAEALLATFNALLRIARIESGAYRSAFADVDLTRIVRDVCELYQAAAEERRIALECPGLESAPPATVFGDRELLAQALTNVLDNAIKYTPEGGSIRIALDRGAGAVQTYVVRVADTGPGIDPHDRERVLQRFARLDQARSLPGNGLGLSLVKAVADQHDGRLCLKDNRPGLLVELELPASAAQGPKP